MGKCKFSTERLNLFKNLSSLENGCLYYSVPSSGKLAGSKVASNADSSSQTSNDFALGMIKRLGVEIPNRQNRLEGQKAGRRFERIIAEFLQSTFLSLSHLRPGKWHISCEVPSTGIATCRQFEHLAKLARIIENNSELESSLGHGYIIKPDIIIMREPEPDEDINAHEYLVDENVAKYTDIRSATNQKYILHASISQKWTIRSDRAQNSRSEALNLIRNRKGKTPHIIVVTAEPSPGRISSIALGTGDIDCVYHLALPELRDSIAESQNEEAIDSLEVLIEGNRLKDISDMPLDLTV